MTDNLLDRVDEWCDSIHDSHDPGFASVGRDLLYEATAALRAAGVVPAEPATHDTSRWEAHRSYGIRDTLTGGTLWCHDADQEPSGAVRDAALAALAAVGGEAPAT